MRIVVLLGVSVLVFSCAGSRSSTRVDEQWLARVPQEQMGGVNEARAGERQAQDDVARARVQLDDSEQGLKIAEAEKDAARAMVKARESSLEAANATGQAMRISEAQSALASARAAFSASEAKVDWRKQDVEARKSELALREKLAKEADARVRTEEFEALRASGDVRAAQLSAADFHESLAKTERDVESQQRETQQQMREAQSARAEYEKAERASQAATRER